MQINKVRDALTEKAEQGDNYAQFDLGELWARGDAVNWVNAYYWFSLAAQNGHLKAIAEAAKAGERLSPTQRETIDNQVKKWQPEPPPPPPFSDNDLSRLKMIPVGYMFKKIEIMPDWLEADDVQDIYSVSSCISEDFADYINLWKQNGYWLFDSPEIIENLAKELSIDLTHLKLFYYEVFEAEFCDENKKWFAFSPETSLVTNVQAPKSKKLEGFDIVTFLANARPEHSPLSCNSQAKHIHVNQHCLIETFDEAKSLIADGCFDGCEPGSLRIFAVYSVER